MSKDIPPHEQRSANGGGPCPGSDRETDSLLVGRIQRRDEAALSELYDRWADRVYAVAYHLLHDDGEAEDIVERTFTRIWQDASRYDPARASVAAWIVVISRSHALSRLRVRRSRERQDEIQAGYAGGDGPIMAASPLQGAETRDDQERIDQAVSGLPEDQERVVRMTFFEGLTQTEIAAKLGVPLGTVKTRVRLAFAKLRDSLAEMRGRSR
jgi:RNA polymerase sigma-70 factor (ECF subfamily)